MRRARVFAAALVLSAVVHALALLGLPAPAERAPPALEILRVQIERADPPPAPKPPAPEIAPPPGRAPPAPREKPRAPRTEAPERAVPAPAPAAPKPLLRPVQPQTPASEYEPPALQAPVEPPVQPAQSTTAVPVPAAANAPAAAPGTSASPVARPQTSARTEPEITDARLVDSAVRYPRTAEQGRVTLRVLVNREGRVARATLEKTSGHPNLDRHALEAVRRWRFTPARRGDEAVEQWLTVNVDY